MRHLSATYVCRIFYSRYKAYMSLKSIVLIHMAVFIIQNEPTQFPSKYLIINSLTTIFLRVVLCSLSTFRPANEFVISLQLMNICALLLFLQI